MGLPGEGSQVASSLTLRWRVLAYRGGIAGSLEAEEGLGEDVHSEVPVDSLPAGTGDGGKAVSQGTWVPPEAGKGRTTVSPEVGEHPRSSAGLPGRKGDALKEGKTSWSLSFRPAQVLFAW